jgi:hypothetical protein
MTNKELYKHFEKMVSNHFLDIETRVGSAMDRIDGLEGTFNTKFDGVTTSLTALTGKFDRLLENLQTRIPELFHVPDNTAASAAVLGADANLDGYETEVDNRQQPWGRPHQHPRNNLQQRPQVRDEEHVEHVAKLKLTIPPFEGRYNPDAYLTWELEVEQRFSCLNYPEDRRVCAATCEFTDFTSVWWSEHTRVNHDNMPTTWDALKRAMRTRFVPPYYQHELLQKLTRLQQGKKSVEEYYQELQTGLIRCGLVEDNEAMLARFLNGLNKEIQTILDYKEYTTITRLFHLACKADREVQDRQQTRPRPNFSAGRTPSWTSRQPDAASRSAAPPSSANKSTISPSRAPAPTPPSTSAAPARSSASSAGSTGRTRDIQCRKCWGYGHIERECRTHRVMIVREDGEYDSASDYDEETLALLSAQQGDDGHPEQDVEFMSAEAADSYKSLVAQRALSVQLSQAEHDQRHNLFQTRGVVKDRAIRIIIDGGSCNNLVSIDMVEKLSISTRQHHHPYHIQWFDSTGRLKVTRTARVHFSIGTYSDFVDCDVVPMQACSLLLGRPWQFDKESVHLGKTNHYTLVHNGKKIGLKPMTPEQILKDDLC